eukprot:TRINITY_DN8222_c0_g1_i2.p1 TRINITY_DN8222_c0_g1~~TRINITY_DN8222_c0_g1_i2.p1  ORF type:complete len:163 (+),score=26.26 TRINITY_DN8222_c0_g1_i2:53-541(+)
MDYSHLLNEAPMTCLLAVMLIARLTSALIMFVADKIKSATESPRVKEHNALRAEIATMRAQLNQISAQDEFARYFKLDRQINAKSDKADQLRTNLGDRLHWQATRTALEMGSKVFCQVIIFYVFYSTTIQLPDSISSFTSLQGISAIAAQPLAWLAIQAVLS